MLICVFGLRLQFFMGVEGENRGYGVKKLDEPFFLVTLQTVT